MGVVQSRHALPFAPHCVSVGVATHWSPAQHPGHWVDRPHLHIPPMQRSPGSQAAPEPHMQLPFTHWSAVTPHAMHGPPLVPHVAHPASRHEPLLQHPPGQLVASHPVQTPAEHMHT